MRIRVESPGRVPEEAVELSAFERLDLALSAALRSVGPPGSPVTVLFGGGIDASILATALAPDRPVRLVSVGVAGSTDLDAGRTGAERLGLPWYAAVVGVPEVRASLERHGLLRLPEPGRSVLAALGLGLSATPPEPPVVVGQGADELFGGYAHFRGLSPAAAGRRRTDDWARLTESDWPATLAIAERLGRSIRAPFLDPEFVRVAFQIPLPAVAEGEPTKPVLRAWAKHRGVPDELADRPKRAIQYGSGIGAAVRRSLAD
jgi:asparagine synthase (glutamine-hydrolysing)